MVCGFIYEPLTLDEQLDKIKDGNLFTTYRINGRRAKLTYMEKEKILRKPIGIYGHYYCNIQHAYLFRMV